MSEVVTEWDEEAEEWVEVPTDDPEVSAQNTEAAAIAIAEKIMGAE